MSSGFCFQPCCEPPRDPYTTRNYDKTTGAILWSGNYFQDCSLVQSSGKRIRSERRDADNVYVGGQRVTDGSTNWNVVAFSRADGSIVWDHDSYVDTGGSDAVVPGNGYSNQDAQQMQLDGDGNLIVMLDSWSQAAAHFIWLDPADGSLIQHKTFNAGTNSEGDQLYATGFTVDQDGNLHIQATDGLTRSTFMYQWNDPFSGSPTLYDIPASGGTAYKTFPFSIERYGGRDWIGGNSVHTNTGFGDDGEDPVTTFQRAGGLRGEVRAGAIQNWGDIDLQIPGLQSLSSATVASAAGGLAGATALAVNTTVTVTGTDGVKCPSSGSVGDTIVIASASDGVKLYPPSGGRLRGTFNLGPNAPLTLIFGNNELVLRYVDGSTWFVDALFSFFGGQHCSLPCPDADGNILTADSGVPYSVEAVSLAYPAKESHVGGSIQKWNSSGQLLLPWIDCHKNQAIADEDNNIYCFGVAESDYGTIGGHTTISVYDDAGTYLWGHYHMGTSCITATCCNVDETNGEVSFSGNGIGSTWGQSRGPVDPANDVDFMEDPLCNLDTCPGLCQYIPTNEQNIFNEYPDHTSTGERYTFPSNGYVIITAYAAGGGGGSSSLPTSGGGGGGSGGYQQYTVAVRAGSYFDIQVGTGGGGGVWNDTNIDGDDGTDTVVFNPDGTAFLRVYGGKGGKSDSNGGAGGAGGAGATPGLAGANGGASDGGNGGRYSLGSYGIGAVAGASDAAVGDPTQGGGGGGGAADSFVESRRNGAAGGDGYLSLDFRYFDWEIDPDFTSTCVEGCECQEVNDDFYDTWGRPYAEDQILLANCIVSP